MGTVYRKFCPACHGDAETDVTFDGFAGAVLTHSQRGGEIVSDGYLAYIADSGDLVPLPHPLESRALKAAGGTWTRAEIQGRLIYIHNLICADCGAENTTASLHTGGAGCITGLVLGAVAFACSILLFNLHPIIGIVLAWIAMFAPSFLIDRYVRIRYRDNAVPHQSTRCSQCGGDHLVSLASARRGPFPCPRCHQKTMTIEVAGRS